MTSNDESALKDTLDRAREEVHGEIMEEVRRLGVELELKNMQIEMVKAFRDAAKEMIDMEGEEEVKPHMQNKISAFKRYAVENPSCLEEMKKLDMTGTQLLSISFTLQGTEKLKVFQAHHVQALSKHLKSQPAIDSRLNIPRREWQPFMDIYCQAAGEKPKNDGADEGDSGLPSPTDSFETLPPSPSSFTGQPSASRNPHEYGPQSQFQSQTTQQLLPSNILNPGGGDAFKLASAYPQPSAAQPNPPFQG
ncbi:hypothetical protein B0T19DRAFT_414643, partial [Cercophora scortea]